jgi:hypothetical protein
MDTIGGIFLILWICFWSGVVPWIALGSYLERRDCMARHNVPSCAYVMLPEAQP